MKIALMGGNRAAVHCLECILDDPRDQALVVVPHGGKAQPWHDSLADFARARGISSVCDPEDVNHPLFLRHLRAFQPDLVLSVYYDQIFGDELIRLPRLGCVNVHPSLLPLYRGVAPLIWAMIQGERKTGVTIHRIDSGVDTGDILMQRELSIEPEDTGYGLHLKAAELVKTMVGDFLGDLRRGIPWRPRKQSGDGSYYGRSAPPRNRLDWTQPAARVRDCVRALTSPLPGCHSFLRGEKLLVWEVSAPSAAPPGDAPREAGRLWAEPGRLLARAGDGWVDLRSVGIAGVRMSGAELGSFLGAKTGERLGAPA